MRRLLLIATLAACVVCPTAFAADAHAHGAAPAVLGVVIDGSDGPEVLRLSRGFAARDSDGEWRFLCPTLWGGSLTPPVVSDRETRVWVFGSDGLLRMTVDAIGAFEPVEADISAGSVRDGATRDGAGAVLISTGETTSVIALEGDGPPGSPVDLERSFHSIVATSLGFELAVAGGPTATVATLGSDLTIAESREIDLPTDGAIAELRSLDDGRYLLLKSPNEFRLVDVSGDTVADVLTTDEPIHGPVVWGDREVVATGGAIVDLETGDVLDDEVRTTCLQQTAEATYACNQANLRRAEGESWEVVFTLQDIGVPPLDVVPEELRGGCESDWLDLAFDAALDPRIDELGGGGEPGDDGDSPRGDAGTDAGGDTMDDGGGGGGGRSGCAVGRSSRAPGAGLAVLALALAAWRRRTA